MHNCQFSAQQHFGKGFYLMDRLPYGSPRASRNLSPNRTMPWRFLSTCQTPPQRDGECGNLPRSTTRPEVVVNHYAVAREIRWKYQPEPCNSCIRCISFDISQFLSGESHDTWHYVHASKPFKTIAFFCKAKCSHRADTLLHSMFGKCLTSRRYT